MLNESEFSHFLQTTLIFRGLSRSQLLPLLKIAQLQTFSKGDFIFHEGSEATGCFIVKMGRVKVFKLSLTGKEQILHIFEAGDNFAEIAALDGQSFPASAAALEFSEIVFFPRELLLECLHQYPDIAINMLISFAQHSRHLARVIEDLSFKDVPQRLATYLLNLSEAPAGTPKQATSPSNRITLDLSKSQLAASLGTIPATLSRAFYRLSREGLITVNGSQIEVLDRDRLRALSQSLTQLEA